MFRAISYLVRPAGLDPANRQRRLDFLVPHAAAAGRVVVIASDDEVVTTCGRVVDLGGIGAARASV